MTLLYENINHTYIIPPDSTAKYGQRRERRELRRYRPEEWLQVINGEEEEGKEEEETQWSAYEVESATSDEGSETWLWDWQKEQLRQQLLLREEQRWKRLQRLEELRRLQEEEREELEQQQESALQVGAGNVDIFKDSS